MAEYNIPSGSIIKIDYRLKQGLKKEVFIQLDSGETIIVPTDMNKKVWDLKKDIEAVQFSPADRYVLSTYGGKEM